MTIKVTIEHTQPGYDKAITAEEMSVDFAGNLISRGMPAYKHVIEPGQKKDVYVWGGQAIQITEGPAATNQTPTAP